MSAPLRFRFAAALILAGLSTSPASSNPFDVLFNRAPEEAAAPAPPKDAPVKDECLAQPGKPADGQHWVYRLDGHRKCWFSVPEGSAAARKPVRHYAAKPRPAAAEENEAAPPKPKVVEDARAELLRPAPAETPQPAPPPAPVFRTADAAPVTATEAAPAPVPATGAAALVPPPPVLAKPDQLTSDDPNPRKGNSETLFVATPVDGDAAAVSTPPASPVAVPIVETGDDKPWWAAPWLGPLLMALGLILLVSPTLRRALLATDGSRGQEAEVGRGLPRSESDSQARQQDRGHRQAPPRRPRQAIEDQRRPKPLAQSNQDTFQQAISALTNLDAVSVGAGSGTPPHRRL